MMEHRRDVSGQPNKVPDFMDDVLALCSDLPEVELAGGAYTDIAIDAAVTDRNLVSAPAWPAHPAWLSQFLTVLGTSIEHT